VTGLLLDTNVISMFAPTKVVQNKAFADWLEERETHEGVFLSAVTIHEIVKGAELLRARGATAKAKLVDAFLQELMTHYEDRILALDAEAGVEAGRLEAKAVAAGSAPGAADAMIAGIASRHALTIVTLNLKHFQAFDVPLMSPEEILP